MMANYNETETTEQNFVGGGSVTASYEDAIKFVENSVRDNMHGLFSKDHKVPEMILFDLMNEAKKLDGYVDTIAFIYGKTQDEVRRDIAKL